jgi:RNA polymerase sigma factor (sigma-70 family)
MDDAPHSITPTLQGVLSKLKAGAKAVDDRELARRLDHAFTRHQARLRAHVASELRGFPDQQIEETLQDVLLTAWTKLAEHDGRHFRAWLYAIASGHCANVRRKKRDSLTDDGLFEAGAEAGGVYSALRRAERERLLQAASRKVLTPQEQEVVHMRYELELPPAEIARLAGFPDVDQVRVTLQRCKRRLLSELEAQMHEHGHGVSLYRAGADSETG